jgi:hypothetical protein
MPYFTSWDANTFLCLIYWGIPDDVGKKMMRVAKKVHEDFTLNEAFSYWTNNSPSLVRWRLTQPLERRGVSLKFQLSDTLEFPQTRSLVFQRSLNLTKEFKQEWRIRSIEERQKKVIDWCKFGDEREQQRHQHRLKVYNPPVCLRYKYVKNLWRTWEAGASSYYFPYLVGWDRRVNISRWYEGIHPGRFFLFYRENQIIRERNRGVSRGPCEDRYPQTPIFDRGPYEQLIEDLKCLDGAGIGESPGSKIEHIDDLFLK